MFGLAPRAVPVPSGPDDPILPGREGLVLLCGGTEQHRDAALRRSGELIEQSAPLVVGDIQSLLRCAPRSSVVIVCGQLAGMSAYTIERLIRQRAPLARLIRADRATGIAGSARRRAHRRMFARRVPPTGVTH